MSRVRQWWFNDLPLGVKLVFLVLLANAVPAIIILMSVPSMTEDLFVWTVTPVINARLTVATIIVDSGLRYLSTDLYRSGASTP